MIPKRSFPIQFKLFIVLLIIVAGVIATPAPMGNRASTNACFATGCHGTNYEMYIDILSYNVSSFYNEDPKVIQCNVSVYGNMLSQLSSSWHYWDSTIEVSASATNNLFSISGSPKKYFMQRPNVTKTASFTISGIGNGSETIKFEAKVIPAHNLPTINQNTTRVVTAFASTQVKINVPPVLSDGGVDPMLGSTKMEYTYEVTYTDPGGDLPIYVTCTVDGTNYMLTPKDGEADSVDEGEIYSIVFNGTDLGLGTDHIFNFSTSDGKYTGIGDIWAHYGPDIKWVDFPPHCNITYPPSGLFTSSFNITGAAYDADPGEDITLVEVSIGTGPWLPANGTASWYYSLNVPQIPDGQLTLRARAFDGTIYSDVAEVTITIDKSYANLPPSLQFDLTNDTVVGPLVWINGTVSDPDMSVQPVIVLVGLEQEPVLQVNLTPGQDTFQKVWSILFDLSEHEEGEITIYSIAKDPYLSSGVKELSIILDIPNIPPMITLDELPEHLWGPVEFAGEVYDIDNEKLLVELSFDLEKWYHLSVEDGRWSFMFNMTNLTEEDHILYLRVNDGENEVYLNTTITVRGPFERPVIVRANPISPAEVHLGDEVTFWAQFEARDHRGTTLEWLMDGETLLGDLNGNKTNLILLFDEPGDHEIQVKIVNAQDPNLKAVMLWKVKVKPVIIIYPIGPTDKNVSVGEVLILDLGLEKGEIQDLTWAVNNSVVTHERYLYFMTDTPGLHNVTVSVVDKYGNTAFITYTISVEETLTGSEYHGKVPEKSGEETKSVLVISGVGILLIVVTIFAIVLVGIAIRKSKTRSRSTQVQPQVQTGAPPQTPTIRTFTGTGTGTTGAGSQLSYNATANAAGMDIYSRAQAPNVGPEMVQTYRSTSQLQVQTQAQIQGFAQAQPQVWQRSPVATSDMRHAPAVPPQPVQNQKRIIM